MTGNPKLYEFGPFRLDVTERLLLREGKPVPLTPKAFETLLALVENSGHLLNKEELLKRIWPDTFVEEATLARNIFTLRKALGEEANGQQYVETVPKLGYRFVAPVKELDREAVPVAASPGGAVPRLRRAKWDAGIAALLVGLGLLLTVFQARQWFRPGSKPVAGRLMLAVLPFENLTGDPQQEYFSDGLTEEMIAQLSRLNPERLRVIARTSAMQYKGTRKNASQIGSELGVDYILECSFRREGNRVRITTQLVRVSDQTHLWSENYERDVHEILPLESEVTRTIAREIEIKLTPQQEAHLANSRPVEPEARQSYLKGRYFWNKRSEKGYAKAIEYFREALERDPGYAKAYAGLADSYALLSEGFGPRTETMAKARAAALKALELDDTLAEAHASLAFIRMHYDWDWPAAEKEFKRAIELNAGYGTAHHWYAYCLLAQGKSEEALQEIRRAEESDPLSLIIKTDVAEILYFGRHYDDAIAQARKALEMDPNFALAHRVLGWALVQKAKYPEAIAELQDGLRHQPGRADLLASLAYANARAGRARDAQRTLAQLKDPNSVGFEVVAVHVARGEKDAAFALLEKAFEQHRGLTIFLRTAPEYDPLRSDPRFTDLLRRVDLLPQASTQ